MFNSYINLIRPYDWIKNLILFLPIFFSIDIDNKDFIISISKLFFIFCLLSSTIYVFNDICDIKQDKINTFEKKNKPLARGFISKDRAIVLFLILLIASLTIIYFQKKNTFYCCLFFLIINFLYSIKLKDFFLVDIILVAISYITRIYASAIEVKINLSYSMIALVFTSAIFIISLKRAKELEQNDNPRKSIKYRKKEFFFNLSFLSYLIVNVIYFYYAFFKESHMKITFIFFFLIITRFYIISKKSFKQSPVLILFNDKILIFFCLLWTLMCFALLYYL